jgi:hypothetical protein
MIVLQVRERLVDADGSVRYVGVSATTRLTAWAPAVGDRLLAKRTDGSLLEGLVRARRWMWADPNTEAGRTDEVILDVIVEEIDGLYADEAHDQSGDHG